MYNLLKNLTNGNYKEYLINHGWADKPGLFNLKFIDDDVMVHYDQDKVYALSYLFFRESDIYLYNFEVNSSYRLKGYGRKALKEVAQIVLKSKTPSMYLVSIGRDLDIFYRKCGFEDHTNKTTGKFTANKKTLENMIGD